MVYRYRRSEDDRLDKNGLIAIQESDLEDIEKAEEEKWRLDDEELMNPKLQSNGGRSASYTKEGRTVSFMGEDYEWDGLSDDEKDAFG